MTVKALQRSPWGTPEFAGSLNPKLQEGALWHPPCADVMLPAPLHNKKLRGYGTAFRCMVSILLKREKMWWMRSLSHLGIFIWVRDKASFALIKVVKRCFHPLLPRLPASARAKCVRRKGDSRSWQCSGLLLWALLGGHTVRREP